MTNSFEKILKHLLSLFLFLLPIQTIWITSEYMVNGVKWEYGTLGFYATELLLWIILVVFLIWYWQKFRAKISSVKFQITKDRIFFIISAVFLLYVFASVLWAPVPEVAHQQALRVMEAVLFLCVLMLGPLSVRGMCMALTFGSIFPALLGIWQFLSQSTFASSLFGLAVHPVVMPGTSVLVGEGIGRWMRAYGTFAHTNVFGGYLVFMSMAASMLAVHAKTSASRIIWFVLLTLILIALFFTFSRSAWIAFGIALLLFAIQKKYLSVVFYSIAVIAALTLVYYPLVQTRTAVSSSHEVRSVTERVGGYEEALSLWKGQPITGVGIGNYTAAAYEQDPSRGGWEYQPVHNVPLLFLSELGAGGVVLLVLLCISLMSLGLRVKHLLLLFPMLPILLLDHYLFSSYFGLILASLWLALSIGTLIHEASTDHPQEPFFKRFELH